jgi:hypothetical protein
LALLVYFLIVALSVAAAVQLANVAVPPPASVAAPANPYLEALD